MLHYHLGILYKRKHDYEKAKQEFLKDIALEPAVAYNYDELGSICLALDQTDDARRYFEQALERDARLPASWYGLAKIHRAAKRYRRGAEGDRFGQCARAEKRQRPLPARPDPCATGPQRGGANGVCRPCAVCTRETTDNLEQQIMGSKYRDPQLAAEQR